MPVEVILPRVDMDMASGRILAWQVAPGARVEQGDPLFEIETDKAAMEVEAPGSGIVEHLAETGREFPIGEIVAWIYAEGETVGPRPERVDPAPAGAGAAPLVAAADRPLSPATDPRGAGEERVRATPLARRLAREGGLDPAAIPGSGPRGRLQAADVRDRLQPQPPAGFPEETGPLAVTRTGGGGAPRLLLHGFAADAASWARVEACWQPGPLVRVDLPCHGGSPKRRFADFADLAAALDRGLDEWDLEPAHLVGHSLGGALALALADARPEAVRSLTLIAPAGLGPEVNDGVLTGLCRASQAASLAPWLRQLVADEERVTAAWVREAMAARRDPALRAAQLSLAAVLFPDGVQAFDLRAALRRVAVPTRILWGRADRILPWRQALAAPGRVALHLFEGVGHLPQIEAPEAVAALVADAA